MTSKNNYQYATSGASHLQNLQKGVYSNQKNLVLKSLNKGALNSRLISMVSGVERSAVPRVILDLKAMGLVKEEEAKRHCSITGRLTSWYYLVPKKERESNK